MLSGGGVSGQGRVVGPMRLLIWGQVSGSIRGLRVLTPQATPDTRVLERVAELASPRGGSLPVIDRRFRLEEAAEAIRYLETQHASAKVVISTV